MANRNPCREWPNCECPKCERYRVRKENRATAPTKGKIRGACHYCGDVARTIDHVIPKSKGGGSSNGNTVPACEPCNRKKGSMDYRDFMKLIGEKV